MTVSPTVRVALQESVGSEQEWRGFKAKMNGAVDRLGKLSDLLGLKGRTEQCPVKRRDAGRYLKISILDGWEPQPFTHCM